MQIPKRQGKQTTAVHSYCQTTISIDNWMKFTLQFIVKDELSMLFPILGCVQNESSFIHFEGHNSPFSKPSHCCLSITWTMKQVNSKFLLICTKNAWRKNFFTLCFLWGDFSDVNLRKLRWAPHSNSSKPRGRQRFTMQSLRQLGFVIFMNVIWEAI